MSRTMIYALSVLLFSAGTLLLLTANSWRRDRARDHYEALKVELDESWRDVELLKDYKLAERSGRLFDSHELDGKVHVVSFFFTSCTGPCFRQNTQVQVLQESYASKGVKFVSITCDPEYDTPQVLAGYARKLRARDNAWYFLTGDLLHVQRVSVEVYRLPLEKAVHSEKLLVVDRWGQIRGSYHWNDVDQMAAMRLQLDQLLAETQPPPPSPPPAPRVVPEDDDDA